jgi:uncharacterized protein YcfJ
MNEKKGPNGFLLGIIIGGAVGALISTKKGRKILKDIADYGLDYVGNSINLDDIETILNDEEEEVMSGEMETAKGNTAAKQAQEKEDILSRRKRLFKGIRKS